MTLAFFPDGQTKLLALFGKHLSRSPSPTTHSQWARCLNLNIQYTALPTNSDEAFEALISCLLNSPNFLGGNITNPFKTSALKLADQVGIHVDPIAARCGAANTLYRTDNDTEVNTWSLSNTDVLGCSDTLRKILNSSLQCDEPSTLIILGAGAMMQTCLVAAEELSHEENQSFDVFTVSRTAVRWDTSSTAINPNAAVNCHGLSFIGGDWLEALMQKKVLKRRLICINTLPALTSPEAEKVVRASLSELNKLESWTEKNFFCLTYGTQDWHLFAQSLNWNVFNGDLLFESQARASFKLWTQRDAPNLPIAPLPF